MKKNVFLREELVDQIGISAGELEKWEDMKILVPSGFTEDKTPCYSEDAITRARHIRQFIDLGYSLEEVQKIIRKVGLPAETGGKEEKSGSDTYLTVGNLAEKAGVSTRTIKHWEEKGIIGPEMRTQGGFRLYPEVYVYLCQLIVDLQNFGYSLEEIKTISDYFRDFLDVQEKFASLPPKKIEKRLDALLFEVQSLFDRTVRLKTGIQRWEDLLKKKKKEIQGMKNQNKKRLEQQKK